MTTYYSPSRFLTSLVVSCLVLGLGPIVSAQPTSLPSVKPPSGSRSSAIPRPTSGVPKPASAGPDSDETISLDLTNVTIPTLVKYVSELTGKNFVIDERVRGKVSLMIPTGVAPNEVYQLFLAVLRLKNLTVVQDGPIHQIKPLSEAQGDRALHIVRLKNANAEDLSKLLTTVTTQGRMAGAGQLAQPGQPMPIRTGGATEFEGMVNILADKSTNSLLITASARDLQTITPIINQLDTPRRQVYVEATIMEVALDRFRELGGTLTASGAVTFGPSGGMTGGFNSDPAAAAASTTATSGLASAASATNGLANALNPLSQFNAKLLLKALNSTSDANVLSAPQVLATNGQKARIVVGSNVPFLTGTSQSSGGQTIQTVERRDIGVTLELTPQILANRQVLLDVRQEISSLVEGASTEILTRLGPSTNKREATTSLIVQHDQTVVIGGLVRDDVTKTLTRVPFLSDIPLLGWFFRSETNKIQKNNLLIFLTPHVIDGPEDMAIHTESQYPSPRLMPRPEEPLSEEIWQRRLEQLRSAHAVPSDPMPLPGP